MVYVALQVLLCPATADEDGYFQNEYFEFVKILDEDGFEIDEIGLSFTPVHPNKEVFATNIFPIESKSQIKEIKSIQLVNKLVQINNSTNNPKNTQLINKLEKMTITHSSSKIVPELAAKIVPKTDEIVVSIKASLCPQPDQDNYVPNEYFEFAKLLDEEGFQLEEVGISFNGTQPFKVTKSTAKTEFYDKSLLNKIKYIQLFDSIICINSSPQRKDEVNSVSQAPASNKEDIQYNSIRDIEKSYCNTCNSIVPKGVEICDKCRSSKLKSIHGNETVSNDKANKKQTNLCEQCHCEVPFGAKICDSCRSQKLKNIHSGEKPQPTTAPPIAQVRTPQSEWKPWPPKIQSNEIKISDINKDVKHIFIGILVGLIVVIFFLQFIE